MCGIFGYIGTDPAYEVIKTGLNKLEYRGYDSCGVCLHNNSDFDIHKTIGDTTNLPDIKSDSKIGIGHTRWATHGGVTTINAHPHLSHCKNIVLVHNGVIENSNEIKNQLKDYNCISETDSEVLVNLIASHYVGDFVKAVENALKEVRGSYGIVVMHKDITDTVICARRGSPLCIGYGKGETFISSDTYALPPHIDKVTYLDDNQLAVIKNNKITVKQSEKVIDPEVNKLIIKKTKKNRKILNILEVRIIIIKSLFFIFLGFK